MAGQVKKTAKSKAASSDTELSSEALKAKAYAAFEPALHKKSDMARGQLLHIKSAPPSVIIFESGTDAERTSLALWYAAMLNCTRPTEKGEPCLQCPECLQIGARLLPNLSVLDPTTGVIIGGNPVETTGKTTNISIDNIRELRSVLADVAHGDGYRVSLLLEAQTLNASCGNALLKIMEEPYDRVRFVITAPHRGRLLPTLVSRGWVLTLPWPDPTARDAATEPVVDAFYRFITARGTEWFTLTGRRKPDALQPDEAKRWVVALQKELALALAGQETSDTLSAIFAAVPPAGQGYVVNVLNQAQISLDYNVNPGIVMDWLAVKLFAVAAKAKQQ